MQHLGMKFLKCITCCISIVQHLDNDVVYLNFLNLFRFQSVCKSVNGFLESLSFHLEQNTQLATYVKEVLQSALPHMNCE